MKTATRTAPTTTPISSKLWPFSQRTPAPMTSPLESLDFGPRLDIAARSSASASKLLVPENQDNMLLIDANGRAVFLHDQIERCVQLPHWPRGHVRLAVLDGMGGHGQGRQAAEAVAAGLLHIPACTTLEQLTTHLDALHATLQQRFSRPGDHDDFRRPGTTLTLLEILPGHEAPLLYHVGDSRLYEITRQTAQPLTIDHVPATAFAMLGLLGEQEWWQQVHGEHRAQITQAFILGNAFANPQVLENPLWALGPDRLPPFLGRLADRRALAVRPDALYLLASDGFWACSQPQDWIGRWPALLGQTGSAGAALAHLFDEFSSRPPAGLHIDNLTAIALRFRPQFRNEQDNIDETALPASLYQSDL
jgi:serine/threonine protein phosphatase PrpC